MSVNTRNKGASPWARAQMLHRWKTRKRNGAKVIPPGFYNQMGQGQRKPMAMGLGKYRPLPWVRKVRPREVTTDIPLDFYNQRKWRNDRKLFLEYNPYCHECSEGGVVALANVSDHIIPIHRYGGAVWSWLNRQGLCDTHHQRKRQRERNGVIEDSYIHEGERYPIKARPIKYPGG